MNMMKAQATNQNYSAIIEAIEELSRVEADLRYSAQPRIVLETVVIKIISDVSLIERVEVLEKLIKGGAGTVIRPSIPEHVTERSITQPKVQEETMKRPEAIRPFSGDDLSHNQMFGNLLNFLRNGKNMSLLAMVRGVKEFQVEGTHATMYVEDNETLSMLEQERYNKILQEYFNSVGFTFTIKVIEKFNKTKDLEKLKNMFGSKLGIKE